MPKLGRSTIDDFTVEWDSGSRIWRVSGASLEKFVLMTNWNYFEATKRFQMVRLRVPLLCCSPCALNQLWLK